MNPNQAKFQDQILPEDLHLIDVEGLPVLSNCIKDKSIVLSQWKTSRMNKISKKGDHSDRSNHSPPHPLTDVVWTL